MKDDDINRWARRQNTAQSSEDWSAIKAFGLLFATKFPRTSNVISYGAAIITFVTFVVSGIQTGDKPLGILLGAVFVSIIVGYFAYLFGALIVVISIIAIVGHFIQPYL
jgi:hypothetical protein